MKKYPKNVKVTSMFKGKHLFTFYTVLNVGGLFASYYIWKNMLTSSGKAILSGKTSLISCSLTYYLFVNVTDFRFKIHNQCKPVLNCKFNLSTVSSFPILICFIFTVFYSIYKYSASNPPITYESDLDQWKLEKKLK